MPIAPDQLATLRSFGYTEVESRFLYLVATHSGYFTVGQFLDFAHAKSGKRNAHLIEKLFSQGHATAQRWRRRSCVYHLHSRALYDAIGKGDLRNRRNHEIRHIKARLLGLDYILAHSENEHFETARAKWRYLVETLKVPDDVFRPEADGTEWITFPDRFPMGVSRGSVESAPVVIFTYVDSEHVGLGPFTKHLRTYRRLFAALPYFEFVYVSSTSKEQEEAAEIFALLMRYQLPSHRPIEKHIKVQQALLRHADIRTTMNIYTQAVPRAVREANRKVVRNILGKQGGIEAATRVPDTSKSFQISPSPSA